MSAIKPTIVFVPGAWNYPSYVQLVIDRLEKAGYPVATVTLKTVIPLDLPPSTERSQSHHVDADAVRAVVKPLVDQGKDVVVLCHSYGGVAASEGLAGLGKGANCTVGGVSHIVYCSALMIDAGESVVSAGVKAQFQANSNWNSLDSDGITLNIIPSEMKRALMADVDDDIIEKHVRIGLHSVKTFTSVLDKAAWREIPSSYIFCEKDRAIPPAYQQYLIDRAQIKDVLRLESSHSPFLSMPDEVFGWIEKMAKERKD